MIVSNPNDYLAIINTLKLGQKLPFTIGLTGELGAGKTTFVKYLVQSFGLDLLLVTSPTYNLQNIYQGANFQIEHWDLYRLNTLPDELNEPPIAKNLRIIEWINLVPNYQEFIDLEIRIKILNPNQRELEIVDFRQ